MPSLPHQRQGLAILARPKEVRLFWRSTSASVPGIFVQSSKDGKRFESTLFTLKSARGHKSEVILGPHATLSPQRPGTPADLFLSEAGKPGMFVALKNRSHWTKVAQSSLLTGPTVVLKIPDTLKNRATFLAFSTKNGRSIFQAISRLDLSHFREGKTSIKARKNQFDHAKLTPLYTELLRDEILLVYSSESREGRPTLGAALFQATPPYALTWRSDFALWQFDGKILPTKFRVLGGFPSGRYFSLYVESTERGIEYFPVAEYWKAPRLKDTANLTLPKRKRGIKITLAKEVNNPILEPRPEYAWEAFASFNPAALSLDNRIHLLYRAQGYNGQSVLGYAGSSDGIHIDERLKDPVFVPSQAQRVGEPLYIGSGGGTGGCEDPRLVAIDDTIYLIYVAFDGSAPPGVALSSISKKNFLKKHWRWSVPRLISRPGQIQKNWVLFPEKINGRFAILHGLSPEIRIEYLDSLNQLGKKYFIESLSSHGGRGYIDTTRLDTWDNIVRGVGAPPLRTKYGWLVFYHGMDMRDPGKYKVGAMLLDLKQPERILRRALEPVLEPETEYENHGHKYGVVYVCGAVIKQNTLFVYYGASDRTSAVATANLDTFLQDLVREQPPTLKKMNIRKHS